MKIKSPKNRSRNPGRAHTPRFTLLFQAFIAIVAILVLFSGCTGNSNPGNTPKIKSQTPAKSTKPATGPDETATPKEKGWRELPERHYDDDKYIYNAKNRYIPKEIREIENTPDGLIREEKYIRKMLKKDPRHKDYLYLLAYNQFDRERYDSAMDVFNRILKHHPDEERAIEGRVYCLYKKEDYIQARTEAKKALKKHPKNPRLMHMLAGSYIYGDRDPEKAIATYKKAIKIDPKDPRLWLGLAESHVEMKTPQSREKAIKVMEETIRRFPEYHIVYILLAEELQLHGDYVGALHRLDQAIKRDPLYYRSYSIIGDIYKDLGDYKTALKYYQRTVKTNPVYEALIFIKLGRLYKILGDNDEAEKNFKKALAVHKDKPGREINIEMALARNELGLLYLRQNRLDAAGRQIDLAFRDYPKLEYNRYAKAMLYLAQKEYEKAEKLLARTAKKADTENALDAEEYLYAMSRIHAAKGDAAKAVEYIQKALESVNYFRKLAIFHRAERDPYMKDVRKTEKYGHIKERMKRLIEKSKGLKPAENYVAEEQ